MKIYLDLKLYCVLISLLALSNSASASDPKCKPSDFVEKYSVPMEYMQVTGITKGNEYAGVSGCSIRIVTLDGCHKEFLQKLGRYVLYTENNMSYNAPDYGSIIGETIVNQFHTRTSNLQNYLAAFPQLDFSYKVKDQEIYDVKYLGVSDVVPKPTRVCTTSKPCKDQVTESPEQIFRFIKKYVPEVCRLSKLNDTEFAPVADKLLRENKESIGNEPNLFNYNKY